jgi:2',3'-cyclic-nucleotide 2'-phosphodiesterase/3'-nucleotidase
MLTKGAGISFDELKTRIRYISPHDFRYYLIDYFEHHNEVVPPVMNNWEFIPEEWTKTASKRDYDYLMSFLKEEAKHTPHFHQSELSNY